MGTYSKKRSERARLKRLLIALGGSDPLASAAAESEIRALGPDVLPEIGEIVATTLTDVDSAIRSVSSAAKAILGSGVIASGFETVRRNPQYWIPAAALALGAALALFALTVKTAGNERRLRRGVALALRALDDPRGISILLALARNGQLGDTGAETLANLLRHTHPATIPSDSLTQAGLSAAIAFPHHELRMECLRVVAAARFAPVAHAVYKLANMKATSANEILEREEARRVYLQITGREA
ncbi:MAG: hypothetical protein KatS3mg024_1059 [Armatimonadota bacterium]|nr:MAG: hypothetical protein KatS3mg024_1059 [Armatimonadota bacterium]